MTASQDVEMGDGSAVAANGSASGVANGSTADGSATNGSATAVKKLSEKKSKAKSSSTAKSKLKEKKEKNSKRKPKDSDSEDDSGSDSDESKSEEEEEIGPVGEICELKRLKERINKSAEPEIIETDSRPDKSPYDTFAIVHKSSFDAETKKTTKTLQINSPQLLKVLRQIVKFYPGEPTDFSAPVTYKEPYMLPHHHRAELAEYAESCTDTATKQHLQLLNDFLEEDGAAYTKLTKARLTTYKHAWSLYRPGTLMVEDKYGHASLARVKRVGYGRSARGGPYLEIQLEFTLCDGENIGTSVKKIEIFEYGGTFVGADALSITALPAYPASFWEGDLAELKETLSERGRRYLAIQGVQTMYYDGLHEYLKVPPDDFYSECATYSGSWLPASTRGRVIVDAQLFSEELQGSSESISCITCGGADDSDNDGDDGNEDSNDIDGVGAGAPSIDRRMGRARLTSSEADPLLAPSYVYGFNLETKDWCRFFVDCLGPADFAADALERLVLPAARKAVIRSLVSAHEYPGAASSFARDEARSKGRGLCLLLHGTPGSGKTLTAELVAEHTGRPLMNISTGELGSWEYRISRELKRLLRYAARWRAVVLIDEADVFLESRSGTVGANAPTNVASDLERNSLVAVFLRQLEYFQGIVFLTSNRVSVFDAAIRSRIHLALHYEPPDAAMRARLWSDKLAGIPADQKALDESAVLQSVKQAAMNGRDISNAVNTARTLARDEKAKLGLRHIETVVLLWAEFENLMDQIQENPGTAAGKATSK